jgi:hypothetical protein
MGLLRSLKCGTDFSLCTMSRWSLGQQRTIGNYWSSIIFHFSFGQFRKVRFGRETASIRVN